MVRWNSRGGKYVDVRVCGCALEGGLVRSAAEALRGVGLGVKVFGGGSLGDGLVAACSVLRDERIRPHRAVPPKPVKAVPRPDASFGLFRAVFTSSNSS